MNFTPFPKIPRLSREVVITEKIDGTNASILIVARNEPDETAEHPNHAPITALGGDVWLYPGSRTRWITPEADNFGFAAWVRDNADGLALLGPGHHFGEWWGRGIQRNYSLTERRFSLFNTSRWGALAGRTDMSVGPPCHVVPVLYEGPLEDHGVLKGVKASIHRLQNEGSVAAPGFMDPEGIVVYHKAGNVLFKKSLVQDEEPKGGKYG